MLKRAKCTIYCAQEKETLGKDSELAITLAQGKPVIVYLPQKNDRDKYRDEIINDCRKENPENPVDSAKKYLISDFPNYVKENLNLFETGDLKAIVDELVRLYIDFFEERAKILHELHPLTMQVDLQTGVSNGVLLVRNRKDCARFLKNRLRMQLEFNLQEIEPPYSKFACGDYRKTYVLREKLTNSPFRVVIGDALLTNSFWNFYLKDTE